MSFPGENLVYVALVGNQSHAFKSQLPESLAINPLVAGRSCSLMGNLGLHPHNPKNLANPKKIWHIFIVRLVPVAASLQHKKFMRRSFAMMRSLFKWLVEFFHHV